MLIVAALICVHGVSPSAHPIKLVGKWDFEECWPQGQDNACVLYSLTIAKGGKSGSLSIDGVQAYLRANVRISLQKNRAVVTLTKELEPSVGFNFKEGEVLFELAFDEKGTTTTHWKHLQPSVDSNRQSGAYFHRSLRK